MQAYNVCKDRDFKTIFDALFIPQKGRNSPQLRTPKTRSNNAETHYVFSKSEKGGGRKKEKSA